MPVATSRAGSLREVAGDAAVLFDPLDPESIRLALERLLADSALRAPHVALGLREAERFRWEDTARSTADVYRELAASPA